jgi:hypothetical protein
MSAMTSAVVVGFDVLAPAFDVGWLLIAALLTAGAFAAFGWQQQRTAPPRPAAAPNVESLRSDSPAVVNMITNDATVTAAALRATVIDLAARGWLRILPPDAGDDLARVRPAAEAYHGDALRPYERLVLQHVIARFTTDRAIPAPYLAVDVRGSWWRRFAGLVADDARLDGLVTRRWRPTDLVAPAGLAVLAGLAWWIGARTGSEVAVIDSVAPRIGSWLVLAALVVLVVRIVSALVHPGLTLTNEGMVVAGAWLAVRRRLDQTGFGDLAPSAQDIGDRRLAYATAMCLADGASVELPLAREDHFRAWSTVGGRARLVRVHYPSRIGFGLAPYTAIGLGVVLVVLGARLRSWSEEVARGEGFDWIYEQVPEQDWLVADVATIVSILAVAPIVIGVWLAIAGAIDLFATVERTGIVIRARRPVEVSPLPRRVRRQLDRDRYRVYLAVDDGSSDDVVAWRANERTAVPQGARATVRASRVLGRVRSATPVGHRLVD